jgi:hypothetical protein
VKRKADYRTAMLARGKRRKLQKLIAKVRRLGAPQHIIKQPDGNHGRA